ncbi:unnamed protein product [Polarella glacialis]|uniref:Peptide-methionine (S)-S-oxide reductase n=1 Tax=Polarella glacialis TaxID=89957 RepID=A0A813GYQ0_POLGL|nr:unnamed protein product [Polarella glacialis]
MVRCGDSGGGCRCRRHQWLFLAIVGAIITKFHDSGFPLSFVGNFQMLTVRVPTISRTARCSSVPRQEHTVHEVVSRRGSAILGAFGLWMPGSENANAVSNQYRVAVYFGQGSFWAVQYNVTLWSIRINKAAGPGVYPEGSFSPALAGYAGGKGKDSDGHICASSMSGKPYDQLGYSEVVGLELPAAALEEMARRYFDLAMMPRRPGPKDGLSGADFQVKSGGTAYRSVIGLPGGVNSQFFSAIERANAGRLKLLPGTGGEPDTLNLGVVYIYDADAFPFNLAEMNNQFHDDVSLRYSAGYKGIKEKMKQAGKIMPTGCAE